MYFALIVTLLCGGAALAWWAISWPALTTQLERAGGVALITGFALLGFALPMVQHFTHDYESKVADGAGTSLPGIVLSFQDADAGPQHVIHSRQEKVSAMAMGGQPVGDRWSTFPGN